MRGGPFNVQYTVALGVEKFAENQRVYYVHRKCLPISVTGRSIGIGLLKLSKPIDYVKEGVKPACLRPSQSHSDAAKCAIPIYGGKYLIGAKRGCDSSTGQPGTKETCYQEIRANTMVVNDKDIYVGAPVVCYDKCGGDNSTKAFVVGVVKHTEYENWANKKHFQRSAIATDLFEQREALENLLRVVIKGEDEKGYICEEYSDSSQHSERQQQHVRVVT
jgi:hypothetical protein